jgi:hypothetical protein
MVTIWQAWAFCSKKLGQYTSLTCQSGYLLQMAEMDKGPFILSLVLLCTGSGLALAMPVCLHLRSSSFFNERGIIQEKRKSHCWFKKEKSTQLLVCYVFFSFSLFGVQRCFYKILCINYSFGICLYI